MANFDLAFYHNSYPVENKESAMLTSSLKTLSKVVAVLESASFVYLGYEGYTFSTQTKHQPDLVQLGILAHLFTSALKAHIAV